VRRFLPFLAWFDNYTAGKLRHDLIAGVTVALVLIPQSMAYAQLAGLPAYYGLYAAFLPPMVASLFGSSHQLATGPVAVVSLMTAAALEPLATAGGPEYISYAIVLALLVGIFQAALGILRLGVVVSFLSHPVVNGFTNAAALIIGTSQLSKIFGVTVDPAPHHYETIRRVLVAAYYHIHWPTLGMAVLAFVTMIGLRKVNPRIPNVLVAVAITTVLARVTGFEQSRKVSLSELQSRKLANLVTSFNYAVTERTAVEKLRAEVGSSVPDGSGEQEICGSCHTPPSLGRSGGQGGKGAVPSTKAMGLHHAAGLLDQRIAQLKKQASDYRTELRGLRFVEVNGAGGQSRLVAEDEVQGEHSGKIWRLKVGSSTLDGSSLKLFGGGAIVGVVPQGLPPFALPNTDWSIISQLVVMAMIISLLGFVEAISIAKAIAARTRQRLDPNQELIGQGLSNIVGCFSQSYAVSGSFSRSAVNLQAGAVTGLSNVFSSAVVVIVLLLLTPLLYHLPQAVLAAVIMVAVFGLLNVSGFVHAWTAQKFDGITAGVTFVATLAFAPHLEYGIAIGVCLSLGAYLYRTMQPPCPELSLHADGSLKEIDRHGLRRCRYITVFRFDGPINFANASYLGDKVFDTIAELPDLRHVLIAGHGISEMDASGEEMLRRMVERVRESGCGLSFSGLTGRIYDVLKRTGLSEQIGEDNLFPTQALAVSGIYGRSHAGTAEKDCPLAPLRPSVVELGLHPDGSLRNAARFGLRQCAHIAALRYHGPLDASCAGYLVDKIEERMEVLPDLRHVLVAGQGVSHVDARGAEALRRIIGKVRAAGLDISFCSFEDRVLDMMHELELPEVMRLDHVFPTQLQALQSILDSAHSQSSEKNCPLEALRPGVAELSLHPDGSLRDAARHHLPRCQHIAALRPSGALDAACVSVLEGRVGKHLDEMRDLRHILIAAHLTTRVDVRGAEGLRAIIKRVRDSGRDISFSGIDDRVMEALDELKLGDEIRRDHIYPTQAKAVQAIHGPAHVGSAEQNCPLAGMV